MRRRPHAMQATQRIHGGGDPMAGSEGLIRVLVVADWALAREGLARALAGAPDLDPQGIEPDGGRLLTLFAERPPAVAIALTRVGDRGAARAAEEVARTRDAAGCHSGIVAVANAASSADVRRCLEGAACGYVTLADGLASVEEAVRWAAVGRQYVAPSVGVALAGDGASDRGALTERERELLRLLALGYTNAEAALELCFSVRTVEGDRAHLSRRLGLHCRRDIVRAAIDHGLLCAVANVA